MFRHSNHLDSQCPLGTPCVRAAQLFSIGQLAPRMFIGTTRSITGGTGAARIAAMALCVGIYKPVLRPDSLERNSAGSSPFVVKRIAAIGCGIFYFVRSRDLFHRAHDGAQIQALIR